METTQILNIIDSFLKKHYSEEIYSLTLNENNYLEISYSKLLEFDLELTTELLDNFEFVRDSFKVKLEETTDSKITPRFIDLPDSTNKQIWKIRSKDVDKFVSVSGFIRRIGDIQHEIYSATFECPSCGNITNALFFDGFYKPPTSCSCGRKGKFRVINKKLRDIQKLVVEEDPLTLLPTQKPKSILVELAGDLCRTGINVDLQPSKKVNIVGLIKDRQVKPNSTECRKYSEANNIEVTDETIKKIGISKEEIETFTELSNQKNFLNDLSQSIVPTIRGHDIVKKAVTLQLFGGTPLYLDNNLEERGIIDILLVGSPGCLEKGTMVLTPEGEKPIESASRVYSIKEDGQLVVAPSIVQCSGDKEVYEIRIYNNPNHWNTIRCSGDHKWFIIRNKTIQVIQTRDLNTKDILLQIDANQEKLYNLREGIYNLPFIQQNLLLSELLSKNDFSKTERKEQPILQTIRQSKDKKALFKGEDVSNKNWKDNRGGSSFNNKEIKRDGYTYEGIQRTGQIRSTSKYTKIQRRCNWNKKFILQAWQLYWTKKEQEGLFKNCPSFPLAMYDMWVHQKEQENKNGSYSSSQRWESIKQSGKEFNGFMPIVPCKITCIKKTKEKVEMYDLVVPETNNFILSNGIVSHNCGKTKILKRVMLFMPGSKFTGGRGSSGVGLIAAVVKDEDLGGWVLDAGVIPQASGSCVMIDEIDKIHRSDVGYLNNAMVDLKVKIDKASIHSELQTETIILASANPKNRVFDKREAVWKQLGLPKDLLDRFDLIFPIHSSKEEKEQRKVAHLIVNKYNKDYISSQQKYTTDFIIKYISYARNNFNPKITKKIENYLVDNFISILKPSDPNEDSAYFSYRLLTNIIRLTQAAAKSRLSNKAEIIDARLAIDILLASLKAQDIITPEGLFDYERAESIPTKKKRDLKYQILDIVKVLQQSSEDKLASFDDIRSRAIQEEIDEPKFEEILSKLSQQGDILEVKRLKYKIME